MSIAVPTPKARSALPGGGAADATQRNMLALQDVEYIITAEVALSELGKHSNQVLPKYKEEIERRVRSGKCFHRPSLGVREFSADFDWVENPNDFSPETTWNEELGLMLYDVFSYKERAVGFRFLDGEDYADGQVPLFATETPKNKKTKPISDGILVKPSASFFRAKPKTMQAHTVARACVKAQAQPCGHSGMFVRPVRQ